MKVLVIISRDVHKGSTRYRLGQYRDFLAKRGINMEFVRSGEIDTAVLDRARSADLLINQKCLPRLDLSRRLIAACRRVVFDFDDAIYTRPGKPYSWISQFKVDRRFRFWLGRADLVTTANEVLARKARSHSSATTVIPMALDLEVWRPLERGPKPALKIGWTGTPVNLPLLEKLDPVFRIFLERNPSATLSVFSGRKPRLTVPFTYHGFDPGLEPDFVRDLDVGLLPLADDEFTRGKSPIKAIQYLACGLPVVGNVLGATGEILDAGTAIEVAEEKDWLSALNQLAKNRDLRERLGRAGRRKAETSHNLSRVGPQLYDLLTTQ